MAAGAPYSLAGPDVTQCAGARPPALWRLAFAPRNGPWLLLADAVVCTRWRAWRPAWPQALLTLSRDPTSLNALGPDPQRCGASHSLLATAHGCCSLMPLSARAGARGDRHGRRRSLLSRGTRRHSMRWGPTLSAVAPRIRSSQRPMVVAR